MMMVLKSIFFLAALSFNVIEALIPQTTKVNRRAFIDGATALVAGGVFLEPAWAAPAADADALAGKQAPSFDLPNSRGNGSITLKELLKNGKYTVLYFYPGAFTQGCTLEARNFQKDIDEYRKLNTQIVGVSVDAVEKNAQFCQAESLDFFMLSDRGGQVSKSYGSAISIPGLGSFSNRQTYIIDAKGNVKWVFKDVESRIARHSGEVLEKLREFEA